MPSIGSLLGNTTKRELSEIGSVIFRKNKASNLKRTGNISKKLFSGAEKKIATETEEDILKKVSEEVDLSMFRGKPSPADQVGNIAKERLDNIDRRFKNGKNFKSKKLISEDTYKLHSLEKEYNDGFRKIASKGNIDLVEGISTERAMQLEDEINALRNKIPNHEFDTRAAKAEEGVKKFKILEDKMAEKENERIANEMGSNFADIDRVSTQGATSNAKKVNKVDLKDKVQSSWKDSLLPMGIGGGMIFAMSGRSGQMSNSELYGQQRPYGY